MTESAGDDLGTTDADAASPRLVTTDATMLRALAHPLRVEILAALDDMQEATATEIAQRVADTPSNCSFHLRQLAKAGYIEPAERRGTSRPWRPKHRSRSLSPDPTDPGSVRASSAISTLYVQREAARVLDSLAAAPLEGEWADAGTVLTSRLWLTADEVRELQSRLDDVAAPYRGRQHDAAARPPGSRLTHLFATLTVDPDREPTPEG